MKLLVDDFLLFLDEAMFEEIIVALSLFSTQNVDVNICLTAVEMSWKVVDFIMNSEEIQDDVSIKIFDSTLNHLLYLARDPRPEIRNCATNTLFSTMVSNVSRLQVIQWKHAFDDVIFKLFEQVKFKFQEAMLSNEQAMTPELKKGVKMTVHYSRNTAQKQWSETTVLALRGLAKIMRTCTRNLVNESWFQSTWRQVLDLCVTTIRSPDYVNEVPLAGIDVIFTMLKIVSSHVYVIKTRVGKGTRMVGGVLVDEVNINNTADNNNILTTDSSTSSEHDTSISEARGREDLWKLAWSAIGEASCCPSNTTSLALHIINNLNELYIGGMDTEFKDSENIRRLFEFVLSSSRSRDAKISESKMNRVEAMQMSRAVSDLIHRVEPVTETGFHILISALAEISFSSTPSSANFPGCDDLTTLHPIPSKLRCEAASFLARLHALSTKKDMIVKNDDDDTEVDTKIRIPISVLATYPGVVVGHFVSWQCASLIANRDSLETKLQYTSNNLTTPSKLNRPKKSDTPHASNSNSSWFLFNNIDDEQNVEESMELELMTVREFSLEPFLYFSQGTINEQVDDGKVMKKTPQSRAAYTVLPIRKEEMMLIFNTIRDVLLSPTKISEGLADKLLIGACCIISPWKSNEIPQTDDKVLQTEEEYEAASKLVEYFAQAIITNKVSESIGYRFIGSVGIISRILIKAIQSLQNEEDSSLLSYYNDLLQSCGTTLFMFQSSKLKSLSSIALQSLINLARDLIAACLLATVEEDMLSDYLEDFMTSFLTMKSSTSQLPNDDYNFSSNEEDDDCHNKSVALMKAFASSVLHLKIPQNFFSHVERELDSDSDKGHVFLILPLGFKACEASNTRLRSIGRSVIGSANFHSLISSFCDMRARVSVLEEENKSLKQQIQSLESAAHIGF